MGSRRKTLRWIAVGCLLLAILFAVSSSRPVRLHYHKWRLTAAKREHLRLGRGEYRFSDKVRELFLGKPLTWEDVQSDWNRHEQRLVELGFLHRKEYHARRGKVPTRANREFAQAIAQMEQACPWWSYAVSKSGSSLTVTATKAGLELWEKLAPSINLKEDKPTKEGRHGKRCGRRRHRRQPATPVSREWPAVFGRPVEATIQGVSSGS